MDMPPSAAGRTRQRRKSDRPQELLEAALALFVERGLANTRAEDIAARAGVSKGTLYLYYPSKDELFKAVVRQHLTDVIMEGEDILARYSGPTADLLTALALTWWRRVSVTRSCGLLVVMMAESKQFPELARFYIDEVIGPSRALAAKAIEYGVARGDLRQVDVNSAVLGIMAPLQFLMTYHEVTSVCPTEDADMAPEHFLRTQIDLLLRGLLK
ncbi:MAG: hypothetical protein RI907_3321 [Pseudomonadota bacterium]|jgi:AcrR family transcriptional regulator